METSVQVDPPQPLPAGPSELPRGELRALVALAGPVITAQLGAMLMGVVDTMMLGRVGETALAAGALGNAVAMGLFMFPIGILMGLDPLISQAHGAGDRDRVAAHLRRGLALAIVLALVMSLLMLKTEPVLALLGQREPVAGEAAAYMRGLVPGNVAFLLFIATRQSLQAMGVVWPAVVVVTAANAVNVAANWALVFGHLGMPRLEVVGSALATSLSRWFMVLGLLALAWPVLGRYLRGAASGVLRLGAFRRLLELGVPIGLQVSLEGWVFSTVALLMGTLGPTQLAGHQIAISLASLSFMVPLGLAGAATTRVGNAIGAGDQARGERAAYLALRLGAGIMACSGLVFFLAPSLLARAYTNDPAVIRMASLLIPIAAAFQIADGTQVVGAGVLRGTADTRWPALIALVGYWLLGLPTGLLLAFPGGRGAAGLWWGLTVGLALVASLFLARIRLRFRGHIERAETV